MKMESSDVCKRDPETKKDVKIATASYPEYESAGEALEAIGETKLLELVNAQVRTNELNRVRALHTNGPGKKAIEAKVDASWTMEDFQKFAATNDPAAAMAAEKRLRIDRYTEEAKAQVGAQTEAEPETANA